MEALFPDEINALEGNDMRFEMGDLKIPFTTAGFILSFSFPNFYFHATTTYDILRWKGAELGKMDFLGSTCPSWVLSRQWCRPGCPRALG